jgi:hypothetical protein
VDIWGVQLETGSVATPFVRAGGTLQGELAACQRYFQRFGGATSTTIATGSYYTSGSFYPTLPMPVTMRTVPSISFSNGTGLTVYSNGAGRVSTTLSASTYAVDRVTFAVQTAAATAGNAGHVEVTTANTFIDISAEL